MGTGSRGLRKHGRDYRKPKHAHYNSSNRHFRNKLKRVLQSCGAEFAKKWQREYKPKVFLRK